MSKSVRISDQSAPVSLRLFSVINFHSSVSVYQQIENLVQFAIASQQIKSGDQLPTIRELSETLKLNPNTIGKAYRDLEVMGYVFTRRGMGVFIQHGIEEKCRKACHERVIQKLYEAAAEAQMAGLSEGTIQSVLKASKEKDVIPYGEVPANVLKLAK